jgi:probable nitrogen fixation protein
VQTEQANASLVTKPDSDPFLKTLIGLIRAEDSYGAWDKKTDAQLLEPFVVDKEARRAIPIIGDPDPDVMHRVEQFYRAVALRIEQRTTLMATPTVTLNHEGFGRVFLTVSKLVAFSKTLRDVHRFGFDSLAQLSVDGEKAVDKAITTIDEYPEVARA